MRICREVSPSIQSIRFIPNRLTFATDWHGHLNFAYWLLELTKPKLCVELGVFRGDSLATFAQASRELHSDTKIVGIDTWEGDLTTGRYTEQVFPEVKDYFSFNHPSVVLSKQKFNQALGEFSNSTVDILHIDGCHEYAAVKEDFESWLPTLSNNGVVLFHDVEVSNPDFGTGRFWDEISITYPSFKFSHSNGLGVLLVGKDQPAELLHLVACNECLTYAKAIYEMSGRAHTFNDKYRWVLAEKESAIREIEREMELTGLIRQSSLVYRVFRLFKKKLIPDS